MGNYSLKFLSSALCYEVVVPDEGGPVVFLFLFYLFFWGEAFVLSLSVRRQDLQKNCLKMQEGIEYPLERFDSSSQF